MRETPPTDDARVGRDDDRFARAWGIGACDVCGRTIVLGEGARHIRDGERVVDVCPFCEPDVTAQGYRRAA